MKILVIHASAGAGHFKAAEAIYHGLEKSDGHKVFLVDALDYTSPLFKRFYKGIYFFLVSKASWLWGLSFWIFDLSWLQPFIFFPRRIYNGVNARKLHRFLATEQFDAIVMTHFMPVEIASALKRAGKISSELITVITDFDVHKVWLAQGVDVYAVASDWTRGKLLRLGVPRERILVSGIPTDEKFSGIFDRAVLRKKMGLQEGVFTVLLATGSFGIGPIEGIISALQADFQVLVVCGHNKGLFQKLSGRHGPNVKVFGLVENMYELMRVADAMVTKPGGLSISEALVCHLPLVFFSAIPGQETGNIRVLKTYGIGVNGAFIGQIKEALVQMKSSPEIFQSQIEGAKALAHPAAVSDIIQRIHH